MFDEVNNTIENYLIHHDNSRLWEMAGADVNPPRLPEQSSGNTSFFSTSAPTSMKDIFQRIKKLYEMKDFNHNIYWTSTTDANGRPVLIRDARGQCEAKVPDIGQFNYAIIAYSYLMSYQKMIALEGLDDTLDYKRIIAKISDILASKNSDAIKLGFVTVEMLLTEELAKAKCAKKNIALDSSDGVKITEQARKQLNSVKKWLAMEDDSITFVTLNIIEQKTIAQIEQPVLSLTDEQKAQYAACQNVKEGPPWFMKLSVLERKLILSYKKAIMAGCVIPSQLRNKLPGIKNAYVHLMEELILPRVEDLSDAQKAQFSACKAVGDGPVWFLELNETDQQWILANTARILTDELSVIDIQRQMPRLTQVYIEEIRHYLLPPIDMICEPITQYYHCGTIVHLDPLEMDEKTKNKIVSQESKDITAMNARQQMAATRTDPTSRHQTVMMTLNSLYADRALTAINTLQGKAYSGEDERIVAQTESVVTPGFSTSKVCLNNARLIEKISPTGIAAVCRNADKLFAVIYQQDLVARLLDRKTNMRAIQSELRWALNRYDEVIPEDLRNILVKLRKKIDKCRELVESEPLLKLKMDKDVIGLTVVRLTCEIAELTNQVLKSYQRIDELEHAGICTMGVFFGCASGNNRTGFQEFENNFQALKEWCVEQDIDIDPAALQKILAMSYHIQLIKGFQGGDFGLDGIRAKSAGSAPQEYTEEARKLLISEWSDIKSAQEVNIGGKALQAKLAAYSRERDKKAASQTSTSTSSSSSSRGSSADDDRPSSDDDADTQKFQSTR